MPNGNILCSWSGGKDSCFALMLAIKQGYEPAALLNVLNEKGKISRSHGIPASILKAQAAEAALPIHLISSSWQQYEKKFVEALQNLTTMHQVSHAVFGDIDLQAHRDWEEMVCNKAGIQALLPLWQMNRKALVKQMLDAGIKTIIVSCNETMGEAFLGKMLTMEVVVELEKIGVDACGENGEYHTLVVGCPLFKNEIAVEVTKKLKHENYWFTELELRG